MTTAALQKRILFVAPKKEAQPVLSQLRAAGHHVSLVEDQDEARALLGFASFDEAVLPAAHLASLLEEQQLWEHADTDAWRKSTAGLAHDLLGLLTGLEQSIAQMDSEAPGRRPHHDPAELRQTIATLSSFLRELADELGGAHERLSLSRVDLEDAVEAAAVAVYPAASERRQRLVVDVDDAVRSIPADSAKLKRVLSNLLFDASRRAPSLGTVTVRAYPEHGDCVISVSHTGEVITQAELRRPFGGAPEPGFPRAAAGVESLERLVKQQGGRLWIESQKATGTAAFISLPLPAEGPEGQLAAVNPD